MNLNQINIRSPFKSMEKIYQKRLGNLKGILITVKGINMRWNRGIIYMYIYIIIWNINTVKELEILFSLPLNKFGVKGPHILSLLTENKKV